jgi:hypothetical protein
VAVCIRAGEQGGGAPPHVGRATVEVLGRRWRWRWGSLRGPCRVLSLWGYSAGLQD